MHHQPTRPLGQGKPHDQRYCALPTVSLVENDNAWYLQSIDARPAKAFNRCHTDVSLLVHDAFLKKDGDGPGDEAN